MEYTNETTNNEKQFNLPNTIKYITFFFILNKVGFILKLKIENKKSIFSYYKTL